MIQISRVVRNIVEQDEIVQQAMSRKIINYSAYARLIRKDVEKETKKVVSDKSITVALSRVAKNYKEANKTEIVRATNLSVHSDLAMVSYEKTRENLKRIRAIYEKIPGNLQTYLAITCGISEITVIAEVAVIEQVRELLGNSEVQYEAGNLSGITVKFPIEYVSGRPCVIFEFFRKIVIKNINLYEIISTTTELTFIVGEKDTGLAVTQLTSFLRV